MDVPVTALCAWFYGAYEERQDKLPDEYWVWLDDQPDDCEQAS